MLVVMALVGGVTVPVVDVIRVVAVGHSFVSAAFGVYVVVVLVGDMRQVMLVVMALVRGMRVPLVDVVKVTVVRDRGVPALRPMEMVVPGMGIVSGSHGSWSPLVR
jgi:hypothetical protein